MKVKNGNGLKRFYWTVGIIVLLVGMIFGVDAAIDKKVACHPSVTTLQANQANMKEQLDRIERKLDKALQQSTFDERRKP